MPAENVGRRTGDHLKPNTVCPRPLYYNAANQRLEPKENMPSFYLHLEKAPMRVVERVMCVGVAIQMTGFVGTIAWPAMLCQVLIIGGGVVVLAGATQT